MNNLTFRQGTDYVPLFSIKKSNTSLLNKNLTKEDICEAKESIYEYIEDTTTSEEFLFDVSKYTRASQSNILDQLCKVDWQVVRNNNTYYLVTQYGLFKISKDKITPIIIAVLPSKYMKYLKMASLIEESFPPEAIQIWINTEHSLSSNFFNSVKNLFVSTFGKEQIVEITSEEFFKYLFVTYTKPSFLMQSQELKWKQELLDGFREEK